MMSSLHASLKADPLVVEQLLQHLVKALSNEPQATPGEMLSALFTALNRLLQVLKTHEDPETRLHNRQEIGRVLSQMLAEFGSTYH